MHVLSVVMWFVVLGTGRLPGPVHQAFSSGIRFGTRVGAYTLLLVPTYPAGLWDDRPAAAGRPFLVLVIVLGVVAVATPVALTVQARVAARDSLDRDDRTLIDRFDAYEHQTGAAPTWPTRTAAWSGPTPPCPQPCSATCTGWTRSTARASTRACSTGRRRRRVGPPRPSGRWAGRAHQGRLHRGRPPTGLAGAVHRLQDAVNTVSTRLG